MADQRVFSGVDLCCQLNNSAHHTEEIDTERLLVRRGQSFALALQCTGSAPRDPDYTLTLVLRLGNQGEVTVKVSDGQRRDPAQWWFSVQGAQSEMLLTVHSPPDAPIGKYSLAVLLVSSDGHIMEETAPESFYLLYNPWCKADTVHLPDDVLLKEYIMNENGLIYRGDSNDISSMAWNFGQFEDDVVDICFEILDNSPSALKNPEMDLQNRANPVYVSRIISAMVNSNDADRGVLWGKWTGEYSDGVAPTHWTGSVSILKRWTEDGRRPVRYGQCWVFAAVACTVLRCLGIPTRCITNYSSAHDTDGNLTIDHLLDENFESISRPNERSDMIWNFHCWVESWMAREDLPGGYDGWQVLDPTPQERSDGVYCCGPCPVRAIREGEVGVKYDAPFIFAEVNADRTYWIEHKDGTRTKVHVDKKSVGCNISTKSVYGDQREDVTALYKYPEGSAKEREVFEKAGRRVSPQPGDDETQSPQLKLSIKNAPAVHGTDFDVIVEVLNVGHQDARAHLTVKSVATTYNSLHRGDCQRKTARLTVPAQKVHKEVLRLRYDHYGACVSEHHTIRVTASIKMNDQSEVIQTEANIQLKMPKLNIKVTGEAAVGQKVTAYITFRNPLPVTLKDGVFTVEGAGLTAATEIPVPNAIQPGEEVTVKLSFKPMRYGMRKLLVDFDSDRLMDVKGETTLMIRGKRYNWP
ncbi:protein-glutamine gamma-glutamyltransferase 2-like [Engraulis encrasicolus]|uniref:protein-glutamine gamma-glutamyltransferase 2-like n=1 Tax=Engraulis encrasicolus TaxID=184585 RepID=UPI002FD5A1C0